MMVVQWGTGVQGGTVRNRYLGGTVGNRCAGAFRVIQWGTDVQGSRAAKQVCRAVQQQSRGLQ